MKILFIYPAFERHAQSHPILLDHVPCNEYIGSPSLGIACVAACTPDGFEVDFVDDRIHPVDQKLPDADLYALSFFTPAASRAFEIAAEIHKRGKRVVAGGIFPSMMPEETARHVDAVVVGEGEPVWPRLLEDVQRGELRQFYHSDAADLSTLAIPQVELYLDAEDDAFSPDDYPLQISRGCPFACDACVLPTCMGRKLRFYPEQTVLQTLSKFASRNKRCCLTEDTSFLPVPGPRRRFRKLLKHIASHPELGAQISYVGTSMPLLLNIEEEIFDEMRQAGVNRFYLVGGFDPITRGAFGPGDPKMLEKAIRCIGLCQDHGVEPYVSFLVGNEQDDEGTFDRILEFCEQVSLKIAEFAIATPYPNTPMYKTMVEQERLLGRPWKYFNDANVVFRPKNLSEQQLLEGYLYLWKEFYHSRQELRHAADSLKTVQF